MFALGALALIACAGCGRSKNLEHGDGGLEASAPDAPEDLAIADLVDGDAAADGAFQQCLSLVNQRLGLVCFGDDPQPYLLYLLPHDGGPAVGVCPTSADFDRSLSEGDPGYFPCGDPLTAEQLTAAYDAGASPPDAGDIVCCYLVEERWGV